MGIEAAETPGVDKPFGHDDARYVEICNLVFMQFERSAVTDAAGKMTYKLTPLPKPSIDTGMGLERVAAVLQGKVSNFETDLFTPLIAKAAELTGLRVSESAGQRVSDGAGVDARTTAGLETGATKSGAAGGLAELAELEKLTGNASLRIIADHARAATFLINDGVVPSNEGRGYVLRKIMRRAIRHGRLLGQEKPFLFEMVFAVRDLMQGAYPELKDSAGRVAKVVEAEEKQFARVLSLGAARLQDCLNENAIRAKGVLQRYEGRLIGLAKEGKLAIKATGKQASSYARAGIDLASASPLLLMTHITHELGRARDRFDAGNGDLTPYKEIIADYMGPQEVKDFEAEYDAIFRGPRQLTGADAFFLYETFGLPKDFIQDACRDAGVKFDDEGFEKARAEEQARARASWKGGAQKTASPAFRDLPKTVFEGYRQLTSTNCEVLAIVKGGLGVPAAKAGDEVEVVLDHTSFYGDSGGQVGDLGLFLTVDGNSTVAEIVGCVLPVQGVRAHKAVLKQDLAVGDLVTTQVDGDRRDAIRRNHTGTHLLHAALRQVLGTHVKQAGSAVHPDRLRFDFSHFAQVADEELQEIEDIVNREVLKNARVETLEDVPIDVAVSEYHAMALFGEKYGDKVRVVRLADGFSTELCGGTHTAATGEIGLFKLTGEESVSSGVRRIEAISGMGSLDTFRRDFELAQVAGQYVPAGGSLSEGIRARFTAQDEELKRLRREIEEMRMKSAAGGLDEAVARAVEVGGVKVLTHRADGLERGQLRTLVDNLKGKLGEGVVVLGSAQPDGKVAIIAGVTPGLVKRIQAGKLVGAVAKIVGGSGGGKPEIAEAGGKDQAQIDAALKAAAGIVGELLG
jgi:alanyl-tRNA synthetase